jgi:GNAT superfamily N-acetyltransferase
MGRNNADFQGLAFSHQENDGHHIIEARQNGEYVGFLELDPQGVTHDIGVQDKHQNKGVGKALWNHAKQLHQQGIIPVGPKHSSGTTEEGYHFAMSTGDPVPPRDEGMFWDADEYRARKHEFQGRK